MLIITGEVVASAKTIDIINQYLTPVVIITINHHY